MLPGPLRRSCCLSGTSLPLRISLPVLGLTGDEVRLSNRLYAVLMRYYPAGLTIFSGLQTQIALQFLLAYPTPTAADALTFEQFKAFATEQRYPHPQKLAAAFARLKEAHPVSAAQTITVFEAEMQQLAHLLLEVVQAKCSHVRELQLLFQQHPDCQERVTFWRRLC